MTCTDDGSSNAGAAGPNAGRFTEDMSWWDSKAVSRDRLLGLGDTFARSALEQSTLESYASAVEQFERWRRSFGFTGDVTDREITAYIRVMIVERGLSASYAKTSVSAISDKYRFEPVNPTHSARVAQAKKAATKMAPASVQRKPLVKAMIAKIASKMDCSEKGQLRDLTMIVIAHRGFMRAGELTSLRFTDVRIEQIAPTDSDAALYPAAMVGIDLLWIHISSSKTNPQKRKLDPTERKGETIVIGPDSNSARICPISLFRQWSFHRSVSSDWLFHQMPRNKRSQSLSVATYNHTVKRWMENAGLDSKGFGGHSTRAGGCTDAIRRAVDLRSVKKHGRWSSDAVHLYIHNDIADTLTVNAALGGFSTARTPTASSTTSSSSSSAS